MNELFANFGRIEKNDPEFHEIFKNFAYGEVFEYSTLTEKESILVTLACLIACQSPKAFKKILTSALDMDITPEEVKELLYQSVAYVGFGRAHNFFGIVIKFLIKRELKCLWKTGPTQLLKTGMKRAVKYRKAILGLITLR